jgi:hypothetical protein
MKTRSMAAAVAVAALLAALGVSTAGAAAPEEDEVTIKIQNAGLSCNWDCGTWTAWGAINDQGTYRRTANVSLGPDRFREDFLLTSSKGSFTVKAPQRVTGVFTSVGVFKLKGATGDYASARGHGETRSLPGAALLLTGEVEFAEKD